MRKLMNVFAIGFVAMLTACGGGGGGDSATPGSPLPTASVSCPGGMPAATAAQCAPVTADVSALQGTTQNPTLFNQGVTVQFNGSIDPNRTSAQWTQGGTGVSYSLAFGAGNKDVTVIPTVRLAFGQANTLVVSTVDTLGRAVNVTFTFATSPMTCANNAIWSNPAVFSPAVQDCVAPIGVQALADPVMNKVQDNSCVFMVGAPLSAACKTYAANGTLLFADSSIVVGNDPVLWVAYFGHDGSNNLVLVDKTSLKTIGSLVHSDALGWIIGNPYGAAVRFGARTYQAAWNGSVIALTCKVGC